MTQTQSGIKIPKKQFSKLVGKIWTEPDPEIIRSGFKKGDIFPFNSEVISPENYDSMALKRLRKILILQFESLKNMALFLQPKSGE